MKGVIKSFVVALLLAMVSTAAFAQTTTLSREELQVSNDNAPDFVREWSLQVVKGGHDFKAIQGRYKAFGFRVGRMDLAEFADVPKVGSNPLQSAQAASLFGGLPTMGDDEGSDDEGTSECITLCHIPPGNPENEHTLCVGGPAVAAHLSHGDHIGSCAGDNDNGDDPGDVDCDDDHGNDNGDDNGDDDGDDNSSARTFKTLGWKDVDDRVESIEGFIYLPTLFGQKDCLLDSGVTGQNIKVGCRFSAFVGAGLVRVKEQLIVQDQESMLFAHQDERHDIRPTLSAGAEYITPIRLTVSAGYHSEAKWAVGVGYGFVWQGKRKTDLRW